VDFNGDRTSALAFDRIRDQHFFPRNFRAAPAHETFDRINRFRRFQHAHAIGLVAEDRFAVRAGEMHDRRREPLSVGVGDDERDARINRRDGGVGGA
jgi:hypothetical protein